MQQQLLRPACLPVNKAHRQSIIQGPLRASDAAAEFAAAILKLLLLPLTGCSLAMSASLMRRAASLESRASRSAAIGEVAQRGWDRGGMRLRRH